MRRFIFFLTFYLVSIFLTTVLSAQTPVPVPQSKAAEPSKSPSDPKAKKTYDEAIKLTQTHEWASALEAFRKADKQDGGQCILCEYQAWNAAAEIRDFKAARAQAEMMVAHVSTPGDKAQAQFFLGQACMAEGIRDKHDEPITAAEAAFSEALRIRPNNTVYLYAEAMALAHLKRDDEARHNFQEFLKYASRDDVDYARAQRFIEHPELASAKMAPNFRLTALDGRTLTLESLSGKVVLIDFWATWCGPCREALPHIRKIAEKFDGQPLVVLSISLDNDDAKWKEFVGKNEMTWLQYRDGRFDGPIAKIFDVNAIPATFTIDADGILEDQHIGDANIEGKLKKLVARAVELSNRKSVPVVAVQASAAAN